MLPPSMLVAPSMLRLFSYVTLADPSMTRDAAGDDALLASPIERVGIVQLCYAGRSFHEVVCTSESVFDQLSNEMSALLLL